VSISKSRALLVSAVDGVCEGGRIFNKHSRTYRSMIKEVE
jgi:hypothetical protein